jgi:hypothetical protein
MTISCPRPRAATCLVLVFLLVWSWSLIYNHDYNDYDDYNDYNDDDDEDNICDDGTTDQDAARAPLVCVACAFDVERQDV